MKAAVDRRAYVVSSRAFTPADLSVGELLRTAAGDAPDRPALKLLRDPVTGVQRSWTYAELVRIAESVAGHLQQRYSPGEHVAIWAGNRPEWLFVHFGALMAGLVVVAVSPACRSHELRYMLQQSQAVAVFHDRNMRDVDGSALLASLSHELPKLRERVAFEDWTDIERLPPPSHPLPTVDPSAAALIQYTSGTTGRAKGAMLSHHAIVNATKAAEACFELEPGSRWLNNKPMYTSAGCVFTTLNTIWNRGTQVLVPNADPLVLMRSVKEEAVNWMPLPPTVAVALLDRPEAANCDFSSVKVVVSGGTAVAPELVRRIERDLGVDVMITMGQTEASGAVCLSARRDTLEHRTSTIGYPLGGVEIKISDPETHKILQLGEIGEICIRGPLVMLGYYNMPEATSSALDAEGWLHSGDLGLLDPDGYPRITGRLKEMIIRGGNNIYPREIEDVLCEHPAVAECAVFGVPDRKYGELVAAAIRKREGVSLSEEEVRAHIAERLARYKLPSHILFVNSFPLTLSGKIQKFALRDEFIAKQVAAAEESRDPHAIGS